MRRNLETACFSSAEDFGRSPVRGLSNGSARREHAAAGIHEGSDRDVGANVARNENEAPPAVVRGSGTSKSLDLSTSTPRRRSPACACGRLPPSGMDRVARNTRCCDSEALVVSSSSRRTVPGPTSSSKVRWAPSSACSHHRCQSPYPSTPARASKSACWARRNAAAPNPCSDATDSSFLASSMHLARRLARAHEREDALKEVELAQANPRVRLLQERRAHNVGAGVGVAGVLGPRRDVPAPDAKSTVTPEKLAGSEPKRPNIEKNRRKMRRYASASRRR